MKILTVYECEYCKKLFRTPNRHNCKMNPKLKNCWTCKHCKGWNEGEIVGAGFLNNEPHYPSCECECERWDLDMIKQLKYNIQCKSWEEGEYDWIENECKIENPF